MMSDVRDRTKCDHALRIKDGLVVSPYESICGAPLVGRTASVSGYDVSCRSCLLALGMLDERTDAQKERDFNGAVWRGWTAGQNPPDTPTMQRMDISTKA